MKFGLSVPVQHRPDEPSAVRIRELLEQVRLARDLGFHSISASQHYLASPFQYLQPIPLLARIAAESGAMTLITNILLLPLYHPVDLAEQLATLDVICSGRLICGVGLGYRDLEYAVFGVERATRVSRFEEALTLMQRLWTEDEVSFAGRHFRLDHARMTLKPLQRPHPPIWIAASSDAGIRRAARLGDAWTIAGHATLATLTQQVQLYRDTLQALGKPFPAEFPLSKELYIAPDRQTAVREAQPYLEAKYRAYAQWGQDRELPPSETFSRPFEALAHERFILGNPADCIAQICAHQKQLGITHMKFRIHWPGMPHDLVMRTIRLLGEKVLPAFSS
jgi:alkanesulfonate monooxygenase SsuD/methylene tetrahydromethanopterin reductase-like flavin-dependent oxidoreductase (luciferase family)